MDWTGFTVADGKWSQAIEKLGQRRLRDRSIGIYTRLSLSAWKNRRFCEEIGWELRGAWSRREKTPSGPTGQIELETLHYPARFDGLRRGGQISESAMHYPHKVSKIKKIRKMGFRARMRTRLGRKMINNKRRMGRALTPFN